MTAMLVKDGPWYDGHSVRSVFSRLVGRPVLFWPRPSRCLTLSTHAVGKAGWRFVQTPLCRWWCSPVAGKTLEWPEDDDGVPACHESIAESPRVSVWTL